MSTSTDLVPVDAPAILDDDALAGVRVGLADAFDALDTYAGDLPALARIINGLTAVTSDLRSIGHKAKRLAYDALPIKEYRYRGEDRVKRVAAVVDHVGVVEPVESAGEWLLRDLIRAAVDNGDINHPLDVVAIVVECAGISYWKGASPKNGDPTGIAKWGLVKADYATWHDAGLDPSVKIVAPQIQQ
jgi:hypothetical protein